MTQAYICDYNVIYAITTLYTVNTVTFMIIVTYINFAFEGPIRSTFRV